MVKDMLLNVAGIAVAAYLGITALMFLMQGQLLYLPNLPTREIEMTPDAYGLSWDEAWLETTDGETLHAWIVRADAPRGTVLIAHGNAGNISHRLDTLRIWHDLGFDAFIFDYRGYGRSSGRPNEAGTYADARAAWDWLSEVDGVEPGRIVLFGRSLGAAVVTQLAGEVDAGALVVESPFTSVPDLAAELYPWLPVRWIARFHYPVRDRIGDAGCPVLVVHSRDDEIIPFHHGEKVLAAAQEPKALLELSGGHNVGFMLAGERYSHGLDTFLRTAGF